MDVPFKDNIKLDKFLSDAQREWVEHSVVGFGTNTSAGGQYSSHVRAAKRVLCWANCAGIGIEDLNSKV